MSPEEIKQEIEDRITARDTSINLSEFISPKLGWRFWALGQQLGAKPEVFLCCLLTAMSALYKVGTKLTLGQNIGLKVPPNLCGAIVAESGQRKTPIIRNIISEPFKKLKEKTHKEYETAKKEYERNLAFPNQGMLCLVDESEGLFRLLEGSDKEDLLSFYDGEGASILRANGTRVAFDNSILSIFGSIAPNVLSKLKISPSDANDRWARFLFVNQPLAAGNLGIGDDDDEPILGDLIEEIYLTIDELPEIQFYLDSEAESLFSKYYDELKEKRISHPKPAIRRIMDITIGRIGKLAINLHCLNSILEEKEIEASIGKETLAAAAKLALWFAQQTIYTISLLKEPEPNILAPHLVKVLKIAEKKEIVNARDVLQTYNNKYRPTASQVREWFKI